MKTVKIARAHALAGLATMLLGSVAWSTSALSQNNSTTSATNTDASSNAATADVTAGGQSFGNNFGRSPSRGGGADPGVRSGAPGAGGPLQGLNNAELQYFNASKDVFQEVDAVPDGLGPRFNLDSCAGCHSFPSIGGSSPPNNPQVAVATAAGAKNVLPSFITANGPIREARFVRNPDGSADGSVHALFVITGRSDAQGCNIQQPNFAAQLARNNVVFRIPTPTFGLGLVENVPDSALQSSLAANAHQKRALGISGHFNINGNDTTIARFGWKAQNKSLLLFSGEAYNVEMGVTNDGGRIVYMLDTGALRDLKFATYTFENNSQGKFMLQIMFGQSKYYSDALSDNVKRGNLTKLQHGWRPNTAPLGYVNDKTTKMIIPDPIYFPIVQRLFQRMLTRAYSFPRRPGGCFVCCP